MLKLNFPRCSLFCHPASKSTTCKPGQRRVVFRSRVSVQKVFAAAKSDAKISHVVQEGETLSSIALQYGVPLATLREANEDALNTPAKRDIRAGGGRVLRRTDIIYVGEVLAIPRPAQAVETLAPPAQPTAETAPAAGLPAGLVAVAAAAGLAVAAGVVRAAKSAISKPQEDYQAKDQGEEREAQGLGEGQRRAPEGAADAGKVEAAVGSGVPPGAADVAAPVDGGTAAPAEALVRGEDSSKGGGGAAEAEAPTVAKWVLAQRSALASSSGSLQSTGTLSLTQGSSDGTGDDAAEGPGSGSHQGRGGEAAGAAAGEEGQRLSSGEEERSEAAGVLQGGGAPQGVFEEGLGRAITLAHSLERLSSSEEQSDAPHPSVVAGPVQRSPSASGGTDAGDSGARGRAENGMMTDSGNGSTLINAGTEDGDGRAQPGNPPIPAAGSSGSSADDGESLKAPEADGVPHQGDASKSEWQQAPQASLGGAMPTDNAAESPSLESGPGPGSKSEPADMDAPPSGASPQGPDEGAPVAETGTDGATNTQEAAAASGDGGEASEGGDDIPGLERGDADAAPRGDSTQGPNDDAVHATAGMSGASGDEGAAGAAGDSDEASEGSANSKAGADPVVLDGEGSSAGKELPQFSSKPGATGSLDSTAANDARAIESSGSSPALSELDSPGKGTTLGSSDSEEEKASATGTPEGAGSQALALQSFEDIGWLAAATVSRGSARTAASPPTGAVGSSEDSGSIDREATEGSAGVGETSPQPPAGSVPAGSDEATPGRPGTSLREQRRPLGGAGEGRQPTGEGLALNSFEDIGWIAAARRQQDAPGQQEPEEPKEGSGGGEASGEDAGIPEQPPSLPEGGKRLEGDAPAVAGADVTRQETVSPEQDGLNAGEPPEDDLRMALRDAVSHLSLSKEAAAIREPSGSNEEELPQPSPQVSSMEFPGEDDAVRAAWAAAPDEQQQQQRQRYPSEDGDASADVTALDKERRAQPASSGGEEEGAWRSVPSPIDPGPEVKSSAWSTEDWLWASDLSRQVNSAEDHVEEIAALRAAAKSASRELEAALWGAAAAAAAGRLVNPKTREHLDEQVSRAQKKAADAIYSMQQAISHVGAQVGRGALVEDEAVEGKQPQANGEPSGAEVTAQAEMSERQRILQEKLDALIEALSHPEGFPKELPRPRPDASALLETPDWARQSLSGMPDKDTLDEGAGNAVSRNGTETEAASAAKEKAPGGDSRDLRQPPPEPSEAARGAATDEPGIAGEPEEPESAVSEPPMSNRAGTGMPTETVQKLTSALSSVTEEPASRQQSSDAYGAKMALLDAVYGAGRGLDASMEVRASVEELISQLEAINPEPTPAQAMELLNGRWKLVYTTNAQALALLRTFRGLPMVNIGDIAQTIDGESLTVENKVDVAIPFVLSLSAHAGFEVRTPKQMKVQFQRGRVNTRITTPQLFENLEVPSDISVLGRRVDLTSVQAIIDPVNAALRTASRTVSSVVRPEVDFDVPSYLVLTYLDSNLRISRDASGGVFVLVKDVAIEDYEATRQ
uniref:Plastid lipid associated protein n=2 Tax=Tetraselmis sp. GSL018 TaxID=582737 RepID=A0A061SGE8_9CHLO